MQTKAGTGSRNVTTARMTAILSAWPWWTVQLHPQSWVDVGVLQWVWMFASTVCLHLLRAGLVASMPLHRLPLSRDHQFLRLQWARERRHWHAEWRNVVFSDESCFNMSYNDGCICVRRYAGECNLRACILHQHRGPLLSVMVWGTIGYNMRACFLCIRGQSEQQPLH